VVVDVGLSDLPPAVVQQIEQRYWLPIQAGALVENFVDDPELMANAHAHPALFADHGLTHVRDIARTAVELASRNDGVLISARTADRARRLRQLVLGLTYLHDIGMAAPTVEARRVHPQFAAQVAMGVEFSDLIEQIWDHDPSLRQRLEQVCAAIGDAVEARLLLREVLAMTVCHSKSAVPAAVLSDRQLLRCLVQRAVFTPLGLQNEPLPVLAGRPWSADEHTSAAAAHYREWQRQSFAWLTHPSVAATELADDVIDAARLLRAADALRQRGVALCTSGGFEICADPATGDAVYGLRSGDGRNAVVLAVHNPVSAAESNIAFARLVSNGDLQVGFHRTFDVPSVRQLVIETTAHLVADIEADAIESFEWDTAPPRVHLIAVPGDRAFTESIAALAEQRTPRLRGRVVSVAPEAADADHPDLRWLSRGTALTSSDPRLAELFANMAEHGLDTSRIDVDAAAVGLCLVTVQAGTELLQVDTRSPVVIVPLGHGLRVHPKVGSQSKALHPWLPVGVTGVVRGGVRNAAVVADHPVEVAVVPAGVFIREWFRPCSVEHVPEVVARWNTNRLPA
jgi:hypothetical protein